MMQWGCDHCRQMIGGPPQDPAPFAGASSPGPVAAPSVPACPRCWAPGTWHAQIGKWGCDRCQSSFEPAVIAAAGASAGAKVAKFFLWMILIIVVIAIKVALRRRW
jgi:ribosomal protein L37AE/L43A